MIIRQACPEEAALLSQLAVRSKAYWGYSADFMAACIAELSVSKADIDSDHFHCRVAVLDQEIVGFSVLENFSGDEIELGALFVDPDHIGSGIGKTLFESAKQQAVALGARKLNIQGDPHAERFYLAAGAVLTGEKPSGSIAGRFLPTYQAVL